MTLGATVHGRTLNRTGAWSWRRATVVAVLVLLLMPVSYRAGAATPHVHALIQLVSEASTGSPAHHHGVHEANPHQHTPGDVASAQAGSPAIQVVAPAALLPAVVLAIAIRARRVFGRPSSEAMRARCQPEPPHPPPQGAAPGTDSP